MKTIVTLSAPDASSKDKVYVKENNIWYLDGKEVKNKKFWRLLDDIHNGWQEFYKAPKK